ncbi:MAG: chromate transporter [Firmicutes bacterium]|nr:chromate transporter [Bacillota bacterium]
MPADKTANTPDPAHTLTIPALIFQIFSVFFSIGAFTFGGGYAMVPLIQRDIVERRRWLERGDFVDSLAIAQSAPGPIAINVAVMTGYKIAGVPGAMVATLGAALPSFITLLVIAAFFLGIQDVPAVQAFLKGMRPAIVSLILASVIPIGRTAIASWSGLIISALALAALVGLNLHPILVIVFAGIAGLIIETLPRTPRESKGSETE